MDQVKSRKVTLPTTATSDTGLASFDDVKQDTKNVQEKRQYPTEQEELQASRFANTIENIFWISASLLSGWHSDILAETIVKGNEQIRWGFVKLASLGFCVFVGIFWYLNYWLVWKGRIRPDELSRDWKQTAPTVIPVATFAGLITCASFVTAYFPLYGWLTFVYFYSFFLGFVTLISLFG